MLWNAVGSLYSERLQRLRGFFVLVPLAVLAYSATAPLLNAYTIALPVWLRTLAFGLHLGLAGVVVGAMFPISLRTFRTAPVSSMFFIDLLGCGVAPIGFWLAMSLQGVWLVAAGCVASYGIVAIVLSRR